MAHSQGSKSPPESSSRHTFSHSPTSSAVRRQSVHMSGSSMASTSSLTSSSPYTNSSPRVQLVPHAHRLSYDANLSPTEQEILEGTSFDALDLSSKDFDFEDIFTYDKPQRKLTSVVEVSSPSKEKDWSSFSFSHFTSANMIRQKVNRSRPGIGGMYVKNRSDARKR